VLLDRSDAERLRLADRLHFVADLPAELRAVEARLRRRAATAATPAAARNERLDRGGLLGVRPACGPSPTGPLG
jgi:hypothetical protein